MLVIDALEKKKIFKRRAANNTIKKQKTKI
jgi:hypothetical protein